MDRLRGFFAQHKGETVVVRFESFPKGSRELQIAYYNNYVLPTIQRALWETGERLSERKADEWICRQCPFIDAVAARDLDRSQMTDFLEWLKQYAAENLDVYIEDPKTL